MKKTRFPFFFLNILVALNRRLNAISVISSSLKGNREISERNSV